MRELIIDSFAGGGGASFGIELALGRSPDVAINHDAEAIALHAANHPTTKHYREDVWKVDPHEATLGQRVGLMWLSPDCKHFSKAKGGKPVSKRVRGLAWVAVRWAKAVKPRVIVLENVEEFQTWGPLAENGRPCPDRRGLTFKRFVGRLRNLGYQVEWRELRACDFGAPTIRKRLFLIARCDGCPIVWPKPTHGRHSPNPWRTAAECIDFSIPTPSIFLTPAEAKAWGRENGRRAPVRPLAEATLRRIGAGLRKFVIEAPRPFIVQVQNASAGDSAIDLGKPMRTVTAHPKGGGFALTAPVLVPRYGERDGQEPRARSIAEPMATVVPTQNGGSLVVPVLAGVGGRKGQSPETSANQPYHTITAKADTVLVSAFLAKHQSERGNEVQAASLFDPVPTVKTRDSNALVTINLRNDEGNGSSGEDDRERTSGDGRRGAILEVCGSGRLAESDLGSSPAGGGTPEGGLPRSEDGERREAISRASTSCGVDTSSRSDSPRHDYQSSQRNQDGQLACEHRTDDTGHEQPSRISHGAQTSIEDSASTTRFGNPQSNSRTESEWNGLSEDRESTGRRVVDSVESRAARVAAFIIAYYGNEKDGGDLFSPIRTVTSRERFGLVTVDGQDYEIADIGMRMLEARELYRAQGFPDSYRIDIQYNGKPLTKEAQVRMCGNSVCPPVAAAIISANVSELALQERVA